MYIQRGIDVWGDEIRRTIRNGLATTRAGAILHRPGPCIPPSVRWMWPMTTMETPLMGLVHPGAMWPDGSHQQVPGPPPAGPYEREWLPFDKAPTLASDAEERGYDAYCQTRGTFFTAPRSYDPISFSSSARLVDDVPEEITAEPMDTGDLNIMGPEIASNPDFMGDVSTNPRIQEEIGEIAQQRVSEMPQNTDVGNTSVGAVTFGETNYVPEFAKATTILNNLASMEGATLQKYLTDNAGIAINAVTTAKDTVNYLLAKLATPLLPNTSRQEIMSIIAGFTDAASALAPLLTPLVKMHPAAASILSGLSVVNTIISYAKPTTAPPTTTITRGVRDLAGQFGRGGDLPSISAPPSSEPTPISSYRPDADPSPTSVAPYPLPSASASPSPSSTAVASPTGVVPEILSKVDACVNLNAAFDLWNSTQSGELTTFLNQLVGCPTGAMRSSNPKDLVLKVWKGVCKSVNSIVWPTLVFMYTQETLSNEWKNDLNDELYGKWTFPVDSEAERRAYFAGVAPLFEMWKQAGSPQPITHFTSTNCKPSRHALTAAGLEHLINPDEALKFFNTFKDAARSQTVKTAYPISEADGVKLQLYDKYSYACAKAYIGNPLYHAIYKGRYDDEEINMLLKLSLFETDAATTKDTQVALANDADSGQTTTALMSKAASLPGIQKVWVVCTTDKSKLPSRIFNVNATKELAAWYFASPEMLAWLKDPSRREEVYMRFVGAGISGVAATTAGYIAGTALMEAVLAGMGLAVASSPPGWAAGAAIAIAGAAGFDLAVRTNSSFLYGLAHQQPSAPDLSVMDGGTCLAAPIIFKPSTGVALTPDQIKQIMEFNANNGPGVAVMQAAIWVGSVGLTPKARAETRAALPPPALKPDAIAQSYAQGIKPVPDPGLRPPSEVIGQIDTPSTLSHSAGNPGGTTTVLPPAMPNAAVMASNTETQAAAFKDYVETLPEASLRQTYKTPTTIVYNRATKARKVEAVQQRDVLLEPTKAAIQLSAAPLLAPHMGVQLGGLPDSPEVVLGAMSAIEGARDIPDTMPLPASAPISITKRPGLGKRQREIDTEMEGLTDSLTPAEKERVNQLEGTGIPRSLAAAGLRSWPTFLKASRLYAYPEDKRSLIYKTIRQ